MIPITPVPVQSCMLSGTPIMGFCTSMTFFLQEYGVTWKPEQLHLCSPFFFQGLKTYKVCEDAEKADAGRHVCLDLCGKASLG